MNSTRIELIQDVWNGKADPDLLTDEEFVWLQEQAMNSIVDELAKKNALVFNEVENGMMN
jgi:hypothetical protein